MGIGLGWTLTVIAFVVLLMLGVLGTVLMAHIFGWMIEVLQTEPKDKKAWLRGMLRMVIGWIVLTILFRFLMVALSPR